MIWTKATTGIAALVTVGLVAGICLGRRRAARQRVQPRTLSNAEERWEGEGGATLAGARVAETNARTP